MFFKALIHEINKLLLLREIFVMLKKFLSENNRNVFRMFGIKINNFLFDCNLIILIGQDSL